MKYSQEWVSRVCATPTFSCYLPIVHHLFAVHKFHTPVLILEKQEFKVKLLENLALCSTLPMYLTNHKCMVYFCCLNIITTLYSWVAVFCQWVLYFVCFCLLFMFVVCLFLQDKLLGASNSKMSELSTEQTRLKKAQQSLVVSLICLFTVIICQYK